MVSSPSVAFAQQVSASSCHLAGSQLVRSHLSGHSPLASIGSMVRLTWCLNSLFCRQLLRPHPACWPAPRQARKYYKNRKGPAKLPASDLSPGLRHFSPSFCSPSDRSRYCVIAYSSRVRNNKQSGADEHNWRLSLALEIVCRCISLEGRALLLRNVRRVWPN